MHIVRPFDVRAIIGRDHPKWFVGVNIRGACDKGFVGLFADDVDGRAQICQDPILASDQSRTPSASSEVYRFRGGVHGPTNIRVRCWCHACADYVEPGTDVLHPLSKRHISIWVPTWCSICRLVAVVHHPKAHYTKKKGGACAENKSDGGPSISIVVYKMYIEIIEMRCFCWRCCLQVFLPRVPDYKIGGWYWVEKVRGCRWPTKLRADN